jgi:hypothetical protein
VYIYRLITIPTCYIIAEGENTMPTLEGKTPEQIAKEIINDAVEDKLVSVSGTAFQKLETVVRYLNRDKIQARGQVWFDRNVDMLTTDAMETLINAREKAIVDYLAKKELNDKDEAFRTLVARGINVQEAYKKVYT